MAYPSFAFYRDHARTLSCAIAVLGVPPMHIDDSLESISASFVTANYFTELGSSPEHGRLLDPAIDSSSNSPPVAVLSHALWQSHFHADPSVIGRVIHVNRKAVTVVGVTPLDFASLGGQHPALWMPLAQQPYLVEGSTFFTDPTNTSLRMWGRLASGATAKAAELEMRALTDQLRKQ